jgi:hypothetical protein
MTEYYRLGGDYMLPSSLPRLKEYNWYRFPPVFQYSTWRGRLPLLPVTPSQRPMPGFTSTHSLPTTAAADESFSESTTCQTSGPAHVEGDEESNDDSMLANRAIHTAENMCASSDFEDFAGQGQGTSGVDLTSPGMQAVNEEVCALHTGTPSQGDDETMGLTTEHTINIAAVDGHDHGNEELLFIGGMMDVSGLSPPPQSSESTVSDDASDFNVAQRPGAPGRNTFPDQPNTSPHNERNEERARRAAEPPAIQDLGGPSNQLPIYRETDWEYTALRINRLAATTPL